MVQQEIIPQFVVSVGYYFRQNRNNLGTANTLVPASDYTPFIINNPLTGAPLTVYNENPAQKGLQYLLYSNHRQLNSDYNGVELQARKQFTGKGAYVSTSVTIGRKYGSTSASSDLNNPNLLYNSIGSIEQDSRYQFRVNGVYPLPFHFKVSGNYQYLTGQSFNPTYTVNTTIDPGLTQLTQVINLNKPGTARLPNLA